MFDFGWQEFVLIAFVLVLVVGPKELPKILKTMSILITQLRMHLIMNSKTIKK